MYCIFPRTGRPSSGMSSISDLNSIASQIWFEGAYLCVPACVWLAGGKKGKKKELVEPPLSGLMCL